MSKLVSGAIFRHYKNKIYIIDKIATHSETSERMVIYYEKKFSYLPFPIYWVRPEKMFLETVNVNGKNIKRFKFLGIIGEPITTKDLIDETATKDFHYGFY